MNNGIWNQFSPDPGFSSIRGLAVSPNGQLYVGGEAGSPAKNIIKMWNGSSWVQTTLNGATKAWDNQIKEMVSGFTHLYVIFWATSSSDDHDHAYQLEWGSTEWTPLLLKNEWRHVRSIITSSTGELYIAAMDNGASWKYEIFKLNGSSWTQISKPPSQRHVHNIVMGPNDKIYGIFSNDAQSSANSVHEEVYRRDGDSWTFLGSFNHTSTHPPTGFIVDHQGDLYIAGNFAQVNSADPTPVPTQTPSGFAKWVATSNAWQSFDFGANAKISELAIIQSGQLFAFGSSMQLNGGSASNIMKLEGAVWAPFEPALTSIVNHSAISATGTIFASSGTNIYQYDPPNQHSADIPSRPNENWVPVGNGPANPVVAIDIRSNNDILVAWANDQKCGIDKWDGSNWTNIKEWPGYNFNYVDGMVVDKDDNIYVAINTSTPAQRAVHKGSINGTTGAYEWSSIYSSTSLTHIGGMATDSIGNFYLSGYLTIDSGLLVGIIQYVTTGTTGSWTLLKGGNELNSGTPAQTHDLVIDQDDNIYTVLHPGQSTHIIYKKAAGQAEWVAIGNFVNKLGFQEIDLALDKMNGDLLLFANFDTVNAGDNIPNPLPTIVGKFSIARWSSDQWAVHNTQEDRATFLTGAGGLNNRIYIAGVTKQFPTEQGSPVFYNILQLDGQQFLPVGGGLGHGSVIAIVIDDTGTVYAGGSFIKSGSPEIKYLAKYTPFAVAAQSAIPAEELIQLKNDIATCKAGLTQLENNAYVYSATAPIDNWTRALTTFKTDYLPACQSIGVFLTNHAGAPSLAPIETAIQNDGVANWDGYWEARGGIIFLGNLIMSNCPAFHQSRFDCINGPKEVTRMIGLVRSRLDQLAALK